MGCGLTSAVLGCPCFSQGEKGQADMEFYLVLMLLDLFWWLRK